MERKEASLITISLLLTLLLVPLFEFSVPVEANPIPWPPTVTMPEEHINATASLVDGFLQAEVYGEYSFVSPWGTANVTMYYPVPPNSSAFTVEMDGAVLNWSDSGWTYPTVIGDFPMVHWVTPVFFEMPFTIKTYYEHPIPLIDGNYTFLYAMGSARFFPTEPTYQEAYIRIRMKVSYTNLHVYTIGFDNGWIWKPANFTIIKEDDTDIITFNATGTPLEEDFMLTFRMVDLNLDGKVDGRDIAVVAQAFASYPTHPRWNLLADLSQDDKIDGKDIAIVAKNFGTHNS